MENGSQEHIVWQILKGTGLLLWAIIYAIGYMIIWFITLCLGSVK